MFAIGRQSVNFTRANQEEEEEEERHKRRSRLFGSQQIQFPVTAIQNMPPMRATTRIQAIVLPTSTLALTEGLRRICFRATSASVGCVRK
jgi:hypothetical protein